MVKPRTALANCACQAIAAMQLSRTMPGAAASLLLPPTSWLRRRRVGRCGSALVTASLGACALTANIFTLSHCSALLAPAMGTKPSTPALPCSKCQIKTIRGTRLTVNTILEFLSAGETREEILYQYPDLQNEDIDACLKFASDLMKRNFIIKDVA